MPLLLAAVPVVMAQGAPADEPQLFKVMGQPPRWKPYLGASAAFSDLSGGSVGYGGYGLIGMYKDLINPLVGVGRSAEGYAGSIAGSFDGGGRVNLALPVVFLQAGVDYSVGQDKLDRARNPGAQRSRLRLEAPVSSR